MKSVYYGLDTWENQLPCRCDNLRQLCDCMALSYDSVDDDDDDDDDVYTQCLCCTMLDFHNKSSSGSSFITSQIDHELGTFERNETKTEKRNCCFIAFGKAV